MIRAEPVPGDGDREDGAALEDSADALCGVSAAWPSSGPLNQEIVGFRAPPDGSYYVSVHTYRENAQGPGTVALELDDRHGKNLWGGHLPLPALHQEAPVIEFVFKDGAFVGTHPSRALIRQEARG